MSSLIRDADPDPGRAVGIPLTAENLAARPSILASLRRATSLIRFRESLLLQGAPLLGAAFAIGHVSPEKLERLGIFFAASIVLTAHVFLMNDWAGMAGDLRDPHRTDRARAMVGLRQRAVADLGIVFLLLSLLLFGLLDERTLLIALGIAILSALYSLPQPSGKGVPLLSSAVHLTGGILHFLLGYSLFSRIDARGLSISVFFGLTLTAGHWNHESRDRDADLLNGIRTNAVAFGRNRIFLASAGLFAVAYAYLIVLAQQGLVPRPIRFAGFLYPLQLCASWATLRAGLSFSSIRRLQIWYRALFAVIGLGMLAAVALGL
ncbi:MAG TPA: UbiA family prenyltransferase [Thermoanaerobaculia bacterium]